MIFGAISILGAAATFFLPETCNKDLPSTIKDANNFEVDQNLKLFFKVGNLSDSSKINTSPSLSLDGLLHVTTNKKEVF